METLPENKDITYMDLQSKTHNVELAEKHINWYTRVSLSMRFFFGERHPAYIVRKSLKTVLETGDIGEALTKFNSYKTITA